MAYGYQAVLTMDGIEPIYLDNCSYTYLRNVNERTREVDSQVKGGIFNMMFLHCPTKELWEWGMKYRFLNGKIQIMQTDSNKGSFISSEEIFLIDAACVHIRVKYNRFGSCHFTTTMTLTANQSLVGEGTDYVKKNWNLEI